MNRVALYMRVSTDQQAKHGDSLREQRDTLMEYVNSKDDMIVVSEYIDDGISGQKLQRDEFQRLLSDVRDKKIDIILFTKLDRWFRNLRHYLNTQEILDKNNVSWNAVSQQFYDTTTAYGRTFIAQIMSFAELEAQMTSERIRAVFQNKIDKGEVVSGKVPLGYSIKDKKLVVNDDKDIVVQLFDYFLESGSLRATCRYMQSELGITRDYQSVKNILTNKKYIGEHRGNENYCPTIIDRSIFEQVQKILAKNIKIDSKNTYIFTGLLYCSECGRRFASSSVTRNYRKKNGEITISKRKFYRCPKNKNYSEQCSNKKIVYEHKLEEYLLNNIQEQLSAYVLSYEKTNKKIITDKKQTKKIEAKLERLKEAYLNEIIDLNEYKIDKEKLTSLLEKNKSSQKDIPKTNFKAVSAVLDDMFIETYKEFSNEEKRLVWRSVINKININVNGELAIEFL